MKKSSSVCSSYFSWSLTKTPMILESFCANKMLAILGTYCRFSSSSMTFATVSSETFPVLPWMTLDTVAVLRPNSSAMSRMRMRGSIISQNSTVVALC